jgi:nucleotide-binding universal stress UspA family protein
MYKHILIPTDGSATAEKAVKAGLKFAKWSKAKVTVFTAMPEYRTPTAGEVAARNVLSIAEHERRSREQAQKLLDKVARRAKAAGVKLDTETALSDWPGKAIIAAAQKKRCDLIFIGSRGRTGLSALLLGSQTHEVLSRSRIPTLVYR